MPEQAPGITQGKERLRAQRRLQALGREHGIYLALLVLIWLAPALLPEGTGLRFGVGFQIFFTAMLLLGVVFFWFLGKERVPQPESTAGVLASFVAVYLVTVGGLVAVGVAYPQFPLPQPPSATSEHPAERGKELFWSESVGCFRCHSLAGTGGTRGPDLTQVASRAGQRVEGLSGEQYLLEKVKAGATYKFKVPEFAPIMPAFGQVLSDGQIEDLVAYLLTLE